MNKQESEVGESELGESGSPGLEVYSLKPTDCYSAIRVCLFCSLIIPEWV
jgi:hypothetical protein